MAIFQYQSGRNNPDNFADDPIPDPGLDQAFADPWQLPVAASRINWFQPIGSLDPGLLADDPIVDASPDNDFFDMWQLPIREKLQRIDANNSAGTLGVGAADGGAYVFRLVSTPTYKLTISSTPTYRLQIVCYPG